MTVLPNHRLENSIRTASGWFSCTLLALLCNANIASAEPSLPTQTEAQFRGCDAALLCRFRIASAQYERERVLRVRPDGVPSVTGAAAVALRDRLNALLADMIHQHKRIELRNLRALESELYAASVIVNGADVGTDARVMELR